MTSCSNSVCTSTCAHSCRFPTALPLSAPANYPPPLSTHLFPCWLRRAFQDPWQIKWEPQGTLNRAKMCAASAAAQLAHLPGDVAKRKYKNLLPPGMSRQQVGGGSTLQLGQTGKGGGGGGGIL
jgi:hypothetical protein